MKQFNLLNKAVSQVEAVDDQDFDVKEVKVKRPAS